MASPTRRSVTGLITPSISMCATGRGAAPPVAGARSRAAAQAREPLGDPRGALLLHRLDPDDLDAVAVMELEVLGAVERPADPDLDHPPRVHVPLLHRAAERRAVEELRAEVLVPGVRVGVEVDDAERAVATRERPEDGQRDRMVAADADGQGALGRDRGDPALDGFVRA